MECKYRIRRFADDNALVEWLNTGKVKEENIMMITPFFEPGKDVPSYCVIYRRKSM